MKTAIWTLEFGLFMEATFAFHNLHLNSIASWAVHMIFPHSTFKNQLAAVNSRKARAFYDIHEFYPMEVGDKFPDFELQTHNEETLSKNDLKGQKFVLFAYPRALTSGCTKEACSVRDHYQALEDRGVRPLGISDDPPSKNKKFAEKHELPYDLLCDEDGELLRELGAYGEKKMYGKTYEGTFRYTYIVDESMTIRKIFKKVKTDIHGEEILSALDELGM